VSRSRTAVAPLERLKILMQVQGSQKVYTGVWQVAHPTLHCALLVIYPDLFVCFIFSSDISTATSILSPILASTLLPSISRKLGYDGWRGLCPETVCIGIKIPRRQS
jgi:hypothetical protein